MIFACGIAFLILLRHLGNHEEQTIPTNYEGHRQTSPTNYEEPGQTIPTNHEDTGQIIATNDNIQLHKKVKMNIFEMRTKPKKILLYHMSYMWKEWLKGEKSNHVFDSCRVNNCVITKNVNTLHDADAVVFKPQFLLKEIRKQKHNQVWIFSDSESLINYYFHNFNVIKLYRNKINWTMSFRRDSDIFIPYGYFKVGSKMNYGLNLRDSICEGQN